MYSVSTCHDCFPWCQRDNFWIRIMAGDSKIVLFLSTFQHFTQLGVKRICSFTSWNQFNAVSMDNL
ncbi:hypothetical protein ES332_D10G228700v1 [Gossypium tomentosum]|uniref:Uncharacterized protein n=1 Tax=Gossypium tomentosum TaxID=34277 RepID=A0A5D2J797_GOSTO|nr:hypothetical protein ES332_D10G228700v1 [Gossypium tomentosum]